VPTPARAPDAEIILAVPVFDRQADPTAAVRSGVHPPLLHLGKAQISVAGETHDVEVVVGPGEVMSPSALFFHRRICPRPKLRG